MGAKQPSRRTKRSSRQDAYVKSRNNVPTFSRLLSQQLTTLLACCCRRKRFIASLLKQVGNDCILLAVRGCDAAQEALCLMLEWRLLPNEEARLQIVNALESTDSGKERYAALCQRQKNLQELVSELAIHSRPPRGRNAENCFALYCAFAQKSVETNSRDLRRLRARRSDSFDDSLIRYPRLSRRNTIPLARNVIFLFDNDTGTGPYHVFDFDAATEGWAQEIDAAGASDRC